MFYCYISLQAGLQPTDAVLMYYKFTKDTDNQIEKILKSQSEFIIKILKRPLLPISEKPENAEIIIEEEQDVNILFGLVFNVYCIYIIF